MRTKQQGFTIIELVLVLAITGLVAMVILTGIGVSLQNERYRDTTNQTVDFFKGVYNSVANMSNERPATNACSSAGVLEDAGGVGRGTSSCTLVGYHLQVSDDGRYITSRQVVALTDINSLTDVYSKTDRQILNESALREVEASAERYDIEWGMEVTPHRRSILVARSPLSGVIKTYSSSVASAQALVQSSIGEQATTFCIQSNGMGTIQKNAVTIDKDATSSTGVRQTGGTC